MTELERMGARAKAAAKALRSASDADKADALKRIAKALVEHQAEILAANAKDIEAAKENGMAPSMIDRLALSEDRIRGMADGVLAVAEWPDPVGAVIEEKRSVLGDREVVDFVVAGGHVFVDRPDSSCIGDDLDQLLAPVARYVVPDFHVEVLLGFFSAGSALRVVY